MCDFCTAAKCCQTGKRHIRLEFETGYESSIGLDRRVNLLNSIASGDTHSVFVRQTFVSAGMWTQHKWSYTHAVAVRQSCLWNADTAQLFMIVLIDHECLGNFVTGAAVMQ